MLFMFCFCDRVANSHGVGPVCVRNRSVSAESKSSATQHLSARNALHPSRGLSQLPRSENSLILILSGTSRYMRALYMRELSHESKRPTAVCCTYIRGLQAQHVLSEAKARLEGSMLEGSTNDVVKGVTYIQVHTFTFYIPVCVCVLFYFSCGFSLLGAVISRVCGGQDIASPRNTKAQTNC